jgi:hypothetical protein
MTNPTGSMADTVTVTDPHFDREPDVGPGLPSRPPSMPRWVKVSLVILAVIVAILVAGLVTGGHGPSRHGAVHVVGSAVSGEVGVR